ncbi:uncharacterized protein RAG0_15344 [Rhynchosporium agropyri]|uniref:Uncharacterized protein n=1 Tax=Rhynchosporium agropyri TaxID=914238 RepID=A0A1E1LKP8_9HELO|nr:uncharacterized protein RAG0_15344 [Rhynchosporium agropyri]
MPTIKYPHKSATVYFTSLSPKLDQREFGTVKSRSSPTSSSICLEYYHVDIFQA